jgi:phosphohistidine phosphatase
MSCILYLVRHGVAEAPAANVGDEERRLTPGGVRKMQRAALGLKRLGVAPDRILTSPLHRARETAEILRAALAADLTLQTYPPLAIGQHPEAVVRGLRPFRRARHLVLVGHQPQMSELASYLLTGSPGVVLPPFKKGAVAAVEVAALPPPLPGSLHWFLQPKQLRALVPRRRGS